MREQHSWGLLQPDPELLSCRAAELHGTETAEETRAGGRQSDTLGLEGKCKELLVTGVCIKSRLAGGRNLSNQQKKKLKLQDSLSRSRLNFDFRARMCFRQENN